jgi:hypothetical protein
VLELESAYPPALGPSKVDQQVDSDCKHYTMRRRFRRILHHSPLSFRLKARGNPTPDSNEPQAEIAHDLQETSKDSQATDSIWKTGLQPGQIRLFNLELDEGESISGTLGNFEHKSAPKYIAQSYVCGEGECDFKITVNGNAHYIQPNLSIALRQTKRALQNRESGEEPASWAQITWLWIDAICIDQGNVAEREMQIKFMEHIYRGASMTFISLGKWTESQRLLAGFFQWLDGDAKISHLQKEKDCHDCHPTERDGAQIIGAAHTQQNSLEWPFELQAEFDMSGEDARAIRDELNSPLTEALGDVEPYSRALHHAHPFWQACMELFEADWFSRLWTFQELWLSRNAYVTLHALVVWNELESLPLSIRRLAVAHDDRSTAVTVGRFKNFLFRSTSLEYHKQELITDNIWLLLIITATKRAKLPKDHVFAILGLMDADTQRYVDVDYSKTDAQVFQDTLQLAM